MTKGDRLVLFVATGFGLGKMPWAPGTFGTLAALPLVWVMGMAKALQGGGGMACFLVCLILAAIWIADRAEKILGQKDPGCIVIDEMAGFCVTLMLVPVTPVTLALGFMAFRYFDIKKTAPVRWFEQTFNGGAGVVLDDIMAGLLAAVLLKIICLAPLPGV